MIILPRQARDKHRESAQKEDPRVVAAPAMAACTAGEKFSCAPSRTCWSSRALRLVVGVSGVLCGVICTTESDRFTKTGSGQTQGKLKERCVSAGDDVAVERWNHDALLVRKRSFLAINVY
jgi:hypothetical protein